MKANNHFIRKSDTVVAAKPFRAADRAWKVFRFAGIWFGAAWGTASFLGVLAQGPPDSAAVMQRAWADLRTLASETMHGRGYQNDGHSKAAGYIAERFRAAGLSPAFPGDSLSGYFQTFPIALNLIEGAALKINGKALKIGADYIVHESSGAGLAAGKAYYAGAGLESDWTKASALDGRVAVITAAVPQGETRTRLDERCRSAAMRGAAAVVVLEDKLTASFSDQTLPIPVVRILKSSVKTKIKKASVSVRAGYKQLETRNVVGVRRGWRVPDTAVVLSAHYDHLGRVGEAIFYGANDNASGTALLLSLADALPRTPYSTVFIAFGAEEVGLNGSLYYVSRPAPLPLSKIKYCLNFDLWGNGEDGVMAVGGKTFTGLFEKIAALNDTLQATHKLDSRPNAPNSDHYPFTQKGVPALFFYTLGGPPHYHDVYDRPEGLSLHAFYKFRNLVVHALSP